jgi:hypothetical protein
MPTPCYAKYLAYVETLVPTLRVGMPSSTLCVGRPRSYAPRGNEVIWERGYSPLNLENVDDGE